MSYTESNYRKLNMTQIVLKQQLREWIAEKERNGIKQHGSKWLQAKVFTIGGSSLATIMGKNPYATIPRMLGEKIGLFKFVSDIKPQWGNLFEDVIKRYVEFDRGCEIYGEDLYVEGSPGTSYSPDGLAVMDVIDDYHFEEDTFIQTPDGLKKETRIVIKSVPKTTIVLIEFKCPYSRIPSGSPPDYYIPQVKMGLDLLDIPSVGLFIEGVFRRCTWEQLGNNPLFDRTLVPKSSGRLPLAYGIIGFYFDANCYEKQLKKLSDNETKNQNERDKDVATLVEQKNILWSAYIDQYIEFGDDTNDYMCNDLGESTPELFKLIMDAYDKKILIPWYGVVKYVDSNAITNNGKSSPEVVAEKLAKLNIATPTYSESEGVESMNDDLINYTKFCASSGFVNLGILPWKLFRVDYNFIQKEVGYLRPWIPKIQEIIEVVRRCLDPANASVKSNIYNSYINKSFQIGFSDEW